MCFFDLDTGPQYSDPAVVEPNLGESFTTCGLDTTTSYGGYYHHGKKPDSSMLVSQFLCDDTDAATIDTSAYMDIQTGSFLGGTNCIQVEALKEGAGSDNPRLFSEVTMGLGAFGGSGTCADYDVCPSYTCESEWHSEMLPLTCGPIDYPDYASEADVTHPTGTILSGYPRSPGRMPERKSRSQAR